MDCIAVVGGAVLQSRQAFSSPRIFAASSFRSPIVIPVSDMMVGMVRSVDEPCHEHCRKPSILKIGG